jgi:hypothetical protein
MIPPLAGQNPYYPIEASPPVVASPEQDGKIESIGRQHESRLDNPQKEVACDTCLCS